MCDTETVFLLWCRLTGRDPEEFDSDQHAAFLARPQVNALAEAPYPLLLDGAITTARRCSLPLEHWLSAVRELTGTGGSSAARTVAPPPSVGAVAG